MRKARLLSLFGVVSLAVAIICMIGTPWSYANKASTFKILESFPMTRRGTLPYGASPYGSLLLTGPNLCGMTSAGGALNLGTVFKLNTTNNVETVIHNFGRGVLHDGYQPTGSLTISGTTLYGMTPDGGANGGGTIFSLNMLNNVETVLHSFAGQPNDGAGPSGSLTLSGTGTTLYGMTNLGGANNLGTIFMFDTATNAYTVLYSFAGGTTDGEKPTGSLTLSGTTLYGMTPVGGANNLGTIFMFDTGTNDDTVLHSFAGGTTDGDGPTGSLTLSGTTLYGMTPYGGGANNLGTIFMFDTGTNVETVLHSFAGGSDDGGIPVGTPILSGTILYGMTNQGGANLGGSPYSGLGTIFMFDTAQSVQTILHSFAGGTKDGYHPIGSLILSGTTLYGMTYQGGVSNAGTIFSIPSAPPLSISGAVTSSANSSAMTGVTVTLSQTGWTSKTTTDQSGAYSFTNLAPGSYTVTASLTGFAFTSNNPQPVTLTVSDVTGEDFTGAPVTISGTVTLNGAPVTTNLVMHLTGKASKTCTPDSSGNYKFSTLANGTYKVTPVFTHTPPVVATPPSATIVINGTSATQNFTYTTTSTAADVISEIGGGRF